MRSLSGQPTPATSEAMSSTPPVGAYSAAAGGQCEQELAVPPAVTQPAQDCCYTDWPGCNSTLRNIEGELKTPAWSASKREIRHSAELLTRF